MTPDFSCERCQDSLPWYIANSLSNDEQAAMERHLASCRRCRDALEEWREVAAALHRAAESIPLDTASLTTWANISSHLREQIQIPYKANERITMGKQDTNTSSASMPAGAPPTTRPHRRIPAFISLVAAAAVIALSIGIFSLFAGRGGHSSAPGGTNTATTHPSCAPSQATANLPAHTILTAIAPVGADDGWAVGGASDPKRPTSPPTTAILRLQNCHWTPVGTPISKAVLSDISMVSADEGWAVGEMMALDTTPMSNGQPRNSWEVSGPLVLHYTHGSWQQVNVPAEKASAEKVKMVSADEGWMLLYGGKHPVSSDPNQSVGYQYSLLHYQNGTWDNVPMTFRKPQMAVSDLDARQPGDVWLVGFDNSSGGTQALAAHYSHGVWTPYTGATIIADPRELASGSDLNSVSELSPNDVWVAGGRGLYHFDGTHWTKAGIQGTTGADGDTPSTPHSFGLIAMVSPTQGWAFPDMGDPFVFQTYLKHGATRQAVRYDHGVWQWTTLQPQGATANMPIRDFARSSPTQGWAIAQQIFNVPEQTSVLLYYDGSNWGVVRQQP
ncbi:MAG TPA: zf-HC2 domain-containing protein [Ktedonobacterales bacterium]